MLNRNFHCSEFGDREYKVNRVRKIIPLILGILILTGSSGFPLVASMGQTAEAQSSERIVGYFPWWESPALPIFMRAWKMPLK